MLAPEDELDLLDHEIAMLRREIDRSERAALEHRLTHAGEWQAAQQTRQARLARLENERETLVALAHDEEQAA